MEIQIKAYAYTIDIITEIRYFCKCNNAVFGKFRIIFTCAISKTDCSLHHSFHALFKISGNEKFVRTTTLASLVKGEVLSPERIRATTGGIAAPLSPRLRKPFQNRTIPLAFRRGVSLLLPLHRILPPSQPLQKDNNPSPRTTTLASLVKGRWIDGKAQTVALLHFYLRYIHLFDLSNFSPSRRRDCYTTPSKTALSLASHHILAI